MLSALVRPEGRWAVRSAIMVVALLTLVPSMGPGTDAVQPFAVNVITFDPNTTYQTMGAWEATAQAGQETSPAYANYSARVIDLALTDLGIDRLRVEVRAGVENPEDYWTMYMEGQVGYMFWRSHRYVASNDDADPGNINWSGFHFSELDSTMDKLVVPMHERAQELGVPLAINVNYVAFTGQNAFGLPYVHDDPAEYAECVLATYTHMDEKYNLTPDYWEVILEPDNVAQWSSGTTIGRAMVATQELLAEHDYTVNFIAPSTTSMGNAVTYFDAMAAVQGALGNLSELSYHRYSGVSDANLRALADRGAQYGVDTAMLEHIGSGYQDLYRDLTLGNASSWQQYTLASPSMNDNGGAYYLVDTRDPLNPAVVNASRTRLLRQYLHYVEGGAVRVGASSNNASFEPVAFVNPGGYPVVVVRATAAGAFSVAGLPAGTYGVSYSTNVQYDVHLDNVTIGPDGTVDASIPATGALTITALNLAPRLVSRSPDGDVVMREGENATFEVVVWDEGGADLSYQWSIDGAYYPVLGDPNLTYAPGFADAGVHLLAMNVTDNGTPPLGVSAVWSVTVLNVNRPPVIDSASPATPLELNETALGSSTFSVVASDPDGDALSFAWYLGADLLANGTGASYAFPFDHESAGVYDIEVVVNDTLDEVSHAWNLTILDVNRPPAVTSSSPAAETWVDESPTGAVAFTVVATDPDGDELSYAWYEDGADLVVSGTTFALAHGYDSAGDHAVRLAISDGNATVEVNWTVHVANVNRPPVISFTEPDTETWCDEQGVGLLRLHVVAQDPDDDTLTYDWTMDGEDLGGTEPDSPWIGFGYDSSGDHTFVVTVSDGLASTSWTWTAHIRNVDRPPTIVSHEPATVAPVLPGVPVNFTVVASDPDTDAPALTYGWYVNGTKVAFATGPYMTFVATANERGNRTVMVEVKDSDGAQATFAWNVSILAPPPSGDGDGDGTADGDGESDGDIEPEREMWLGLLLVAAIVLLVFLIAMRLLGRDEPKA